LNQEEAKLELTFSAHDFSDEEISGIAKVFSEIEPTAQPHEYFRMSAETLPALLWVALGFIGGAVASGFFGSIGSDAYNKAKEAVAKALKTKNDPTLTFKMNYNGVEININCTSKDEAVIGRAFDSISTARDLAISEIDNPSAPKLTELYLIHDGNNWFLHEALDFKTERFPIIYIYNKENKKWARLR
jgi:hypothetical protein